MRIYVAIVAAATLAACGDNAGVDGQTGQQSDAATTVNIDADAGTVTKSGSFAGRSDHETTGTASIREIDGGYVLVFGDDFSLDGAPDPVVGFGDGEYVAASKVAALQNKTGRQAYRLGADFDPAAYDEVYVWCEQFDVPLGVAALN